MENEDLGLTKCEGEIAVWSPSPNPGHSARLYIQPHLQSCVYMTKNGQRKGITYRPDPEIFSHISYALSWFPTSNHLRKTLRT